MAIRYFALVMGIIFLVVGALGFVPALLTTPTAGPPLQVTSFFGHLLGLFPVNILHSAVHLLFGIWGVIAWRQLSGARTYAQSVAIIYAVLAVMGLIPVLNTAFGLVPLYGHDIWLHGLIALGAAYFGFVARPFADVDSALRS